ncbi:hypothetical protein GF337_00490 [candidate division KSB1 bacterium]|nr:hypothetical protein [candidate division KSB1 bacterium]
MQHFRLRIIFFIIICLVAGYGYLFAGSKYYINGLGSQSYFTQADAFGRGGTIIAVPDMNSVNTFNPAGLIFADITHISADFYHETIQSQYQAFEGVSHYSNVHGVRLAIPLAVNKFVISVGIKPILRNDYKAETEGELSTGNQYTKQIINKGGLSRINLGLATGIKNRVYLGAYLNYNFGKIEQNWRVNFVSDLLIDTSDRLVSKVWAPNFTAGMMVRVMKGFHLGLVYSQPFDLNGDRLIRYVFGESSEKVDVGLKIPAGLGIGASYNMNEKIRYSLDYYTQRWSNVELVSENESNYTDNHHISAGIEFLPTKKAFTSFYKKINYRIGFHYANLGIKDNGTAVSEYLGTAGMGIPFYGGYGRIDFGIGYGKRGSLESHSVEESVLRFFLTITGGEKWFVRPR